MDDEGDASYPPNPRDSNHQNSSVEDGGYRHTIGNSYVDDDGKDVDKENENGDNDDDDEGNGVEQIGKGDYEDGSGEDSEDGECGDLEKRQKKRKVKTLLSNYELVPRVPAAMASVATSVVKQSFSGRNPLTDWTEHETLILLDAWGDKFLKQRRKSLRSEEWQEVAQKVSQISKIERTDTQCRNRLDTLKKRYKKEKIKLGETGKSTSNWICYKKLDVILSTLPQTGENSGEYAFVNPNFSKGFDGNPESSEGEEDESEDLPPKKAKTDKKVRGSAASFKLLADSIQKFVDIYERIENSKREQMLELEKMRMDFHKDLELQKMQIQSAMIAKMRRGYDEDNDASAENLSD